ncbi:MAG: class I lanthipeptide [Bacteroidetes bacterium]|nr:class I lanthipeptide [Bacteroidota bacterium]
MKKSINKLSLSKSTISNLSHSDLGQIQGGVKSNSCINTWTCPTVSCSVWCPTKMACTVKQ